MATWKISWKCNSSVTVYNNPSTASITLAIETNRWTPTHAAWTGQIFTCCDSYLLTILYTIHTLQTLKHYVQKQMSSNPTFIIRYFSLDQTGCACQIFEWWKTSTLISKMCVLLHTMVTHVVHKSGIISVSTNRFRHFHQS